MNPGGICGRGAAVTYYVFVHYFLLSFYENPVISFFFIPDSKHLIYSVKQ